MFSRRILNAPAYPAVFSALLSASKARGGVGKNVPPVQGVLLTEQSCKSRICWEVNPEDIWESHLEVAAHKLCCTRDFSRASLCRAHSWGRADGNPRDSAHAQELVIEPMFPLGQIFIERSGPNRCFWHKHGEFAICRARLQPPQHRWLKKANRV